MLSFITYLKTIGDYSPIILFFSSVFLLYGKNILLGYYIFGYFITIISNVFLKYIIKQPRPNEDPAAFNVLVNNDKHISFNKYGMPSGHSQAAMFSLFFIYFALKSHKYLWQIMLFYIIITFNTILQRVKNNQHSIIQVSIGAIIGAFIGYCMFIMASSKLYGILKYKADDYALM